ncbi:MAG: FKBP-type peptidyl-prolyl cis-trans isomerase [Ekhidna sp.]|uniref:FKBP-type peptidyl-prolyl cis-trans isomerase n=1 Tax=Ekhidna sp. TaxID=2608089 RepID=UPI0032ED9286
MKRSLAILILIYLISACGSDDVTTTSADEEIQAWLDTMNITASRDDNTGIYAYEEVTNPAGAPVTNGSVTAIYYILQDLNGNTIASHQRSDGDSLIFKVGANAVYPIGVDFSVTQMRVGETYHFILPPDQAYADLTSGAINPNLIANLQIELVGVHNENDLFAQEITAIDDYISDNNLNDVVANPTDPVEQFSASGISYKRQRVGTGSIPLNGDTIVVDYSGRFIDDSPFGADSGFEWIYGSGQPRELLVGFEFGVSLMQTGEQALILIPSSQAYRESALVIPAFISGDLVEDGIIPDYVTSIPPYSTLLFQISRID